MDGLFPRMVRIQPAAVLPGAVAPAPLRFAAFRAGGLAAGAISTGAKSFSNSSRKALVVWGGLLLAFVIVLREAKIKKDVRAFAEFLQHTGLLPADEIIFVGLRPYYGLSFYAGLEVERCELTGQVPLPEAPYKSFETALEEVLDNKGVLLWVATKEEAEQLKQLLQNCASLSIQSGPDYRGYLLLKTSFLTNNEPERGFTRVA